MMQIFNQEAVAVASDLFDSTKSVHCNRPSQPRLTERKRSSTHPIEKLAKKPQAKELRKLCKSINPVKSAHEQPTPLIVDCYVNSHIWIPPRTTPVQPPQNS